MPAVLHPLPVAAKICGLTSADAIAAAAAGGASHVGFVIFPKSPRHIAPRDAAPLAAAARRAGLRTVAVMVDPDDALLAAVRGALAPDLVQLHGHETLERVAAVRGQGTPVIKALGVGAPADVAAASAFGPVADALLLDARPPAGADLPGGLGRTFDWALLEGFAPAVPWFLSGGLDPSNAAAAVCRTGAPGVDVSSGVESAPGVKDTARIAAFLDALRTL